MSTVHPLQAPLTPALEQDAADIRHKLDAARHSIRRVIFGQDDVIDLCLAAILSGGHFLLVGLPGLGKTRLVDTMGTVLGLSAGRIQCTPDLMPADILGVEILSRDDGGRGHFRFVEGPVFNQLLMADEINRASPRTQSALLQAMQEKRVTVGGKTYDLPRPFHVMATQNPLEQEGTYPLPEAQLDRFMLQINIGYPAPEDERRMILATTTAAEDAAQPVMTAADVLAAQNIVRQLPVGESVVDGILKLVQSGRPEQSDIPLVKKHVDWAAGPRAAQAFMLAARARALLQGRYAPSMDDVTALAPAILRHRMSVGFAARAEGISVENIINAMCQDVA